MTALASLLCPPSIPPETGAAAGSGDSSLSNGMEVGHHHEIKPGKEEDYIHDDDEDDKGKGHHDGHSSSAHTDNEEFDPESKEAAAIIITTSRKVRIQCNNNEVDGDKDATEKVVNDRVSFGGTQKPYTTSILKAYPPTNSSPRWGAHESRNDRHRDSYTDTSDSDDNHNNQESYASYKIGRKNLLKIEKLTDSDSRGREKMRSRALSPPSSSDEENLHIG
ncbi:hypothetical protein Ocin01_00287 [Orchesella cincta]|uniref:Uncharacterized protein n=1 Tax=Orchesella cincta TaxID=48709 RepID=A0A1D2NMB0_ORCCI|nr:hypothetical protein Ocin01_00287 [Orchesella cincta]